MHKGRTPQQGSTHVGMQQLQQQLGVLPSRLIRREAATQAVPRAAQGARPHLALLAVTLALFVVNLGQAVSTRVDDNSICARHQQWQRQQQRLSTRLSQTVGDGRCAQYEPCPRTARITAVVACCSPAGGCVLRTVRQHDSCCATSRQKGTANLATKDNQLSGDCPTTVQQPYTPDAASTYSFEMPDRSASTVLVTPDNVTMEVPCAVTCAAWMSPRANTTATLWDALQGGAHVWREGG